MGDAKKPQSDPAVNLAPGDVSLLNAAATGAGAIPLTPDLLKSIGASLDARFADIAERYPALVAATRIDQRLNTAIVCVRALFEHAREGGTYRYLIYERLGFGTDAYVPLCADGLALSNDLDIDAETPDPLNESAKTSPCLPLVVNAARESFEQIDNDTRLALVTDIFHAIANGSDPVEAVVLSGVDLNKTPAPAASDMRALLEACGLAEIETAWKNRKE